MAASRCGSGREAAAPHRDIGINSNPVTKNFFRSIILTDVCLETLKAVAVDVIEMGERF